MEHKIIAAIAADREGFESVAPHIAENDFSPEGWQVYKAIKQFYKRDAEAQRVDLDIVQAAVTRKLTNSKHTDLFIVYFQNVKQQDVSAVNVLTEVLATKREVAALQLADAILGKDQAQVDRLLTQLTQLRASEQLESSVVEEYKGLSLEELTNATRNENLIRVAPKSLNTRLGGGVLRGMHIVVAARPEAGKTALVLSFAEGFLLQGLTVLYVGNEDPTMGVVMRMVSNLSGMTKEEVLADSRLASSKANARGYQNMIFVGLSGGTLEEIRGLCVKHRPDVLIVDQIRNITTSAENRTNQLEAVARGMRNLAREFNLVSVSVTQAGDSAEGKLELGMGDIDGSNTGIPGACDVMLMSGVTKSYAEQNNRMLSLCKNKASGLHDSWTVKIDPQRSRIRDI